MLHDITGQGEVKPKERLWRNAEHLMADVLLSCLTGDLTDSQLSSVLLVILDSCSNTHLSSFFGTFPTALTAEWHSSALPTGAPGFSLHVLLSRAHFLGFVALLLNLNWLSHSQVLNTDSPSPCLFFRDILCINSLSAYNFRQSLGRNLGHQESLTHISQGPLPGYGQGCTE